MPDGDVVWIGSWSTRLTSYCRLLLRRAREEGGHLSHIKGKTAPTPLLRARRLGNALGLRELYLKLETANATGSHKDRVARHIVVFARTLGYSEVAFGTCGNLGVALAQACHVTGLSCTVFVPAHYSGARAHAMSALGAQVTRTPGGYEEAVAMSRQAAHITGALDANPDGPVAELFFDAYAEMTCEILALCPSPQSIWVPSGNGTTAAGVFRGLGVGQRRRDEEPYTAVCLSGSAGNTAVTASVAAGEVVELDPCSLLDTEANEPLVNWRSMHAAEALEAVRLTGGFANDATEIQLLSMQRLLERLEQVVASPAAASSLVGLVSSLGRSQLDPASPHVAILTA